LLKHLFRGDTEMLPFHTPTIQIIKDSCFFSLYTHVPIYNKCKIGDTLLFGGTEEFKNRDRCREFVEAGAHESVHGPGMWMW
jgi:hypothetical protein